MVKEHTNSPKVRIMLFCVSPLAQDTSCHFPRGSTGISLLPFRFFSRPILKFWGVGVALMRITWANYSKRQFGLSNVGKMQYGFGESKHVASVSICYKLFRNIDEDFGGSIS